MADITQSNEATQAPPGPRSNPAWDQLVARFEDLRNFGSAIALLRWDQEVMMPPEGNAARASSMATLEAVFHSRLTDPSLGDLLDELGSDDSLDQDQAASVRVLRREHDKAVRVPEDLVRELATTRGVAYQRWVEARAADDFSLFEPHLKHIVELKKQEADAIGWEDERYDALLDDYEPGVTTKEVEAIFSELVAGLTPLVERVVDAADARPEWLSQPFDEALQQSFCASLAESLGFNVVGGRLDQSPHPFTMTVGPGDVRQTIKTEPNSLLPSIYAAMHETGHALYEQGIPKEMINLPIGQVPSLGMHESQSRLWENLVGRSRAYTDFLLPRIKERFPQVGMVSPEDFYRAVNWPQRSLIRIHADELTYNLHIALRLELELALFRDELEVSDLPGAWNDAMQRHLGVRPDSDANGVLQDVHWSSALHGYFSTYTLGNLYAAALFNKATEDLGDLEGDMRKGDVSRLLEWLRTHVHSQGYRYPASELAQRVLGEPLSSAPLLKYLTAKYEALFA
ncbi:MAG: carboxypeptidase M32 [Actinobacteria bacterium]|nr:carboxypeptidase M32 [Actinomycetota bacterium]